MSINITRVYTGGGDQGETSLIGGRRVPKDHPQVAAYGDIDELNSVIGVARAALVSQGEAALDGLLRDVQSELFDLGNELGTPPEDRWENMPRATDEAVTRLEEAIDRYNADLPALKSFILPAGGMASSSLHVCRTVARRIERMMVGLARDFEVSDAALRYINRLSDLFFVLSRVAARDREDLWEGGFGRRRNETA